MYREIVRRLFVIMALLAFGISIAAAQEESVQNATAQDASVKVRVSPPEAYIFVDGHPFAHRSRTIVLSAGEHTIGVYNYGFAPHVTTVNLQSGKNPEIVARLEPVPGNVTGPWGKVQIEGTANDKAAVFLNGIKPEYFVGYVDEINNGKIFHQKLVLPVGTYQLMLVNPKETEPFYSEAIQVKANERVKVNVAKNTKTYEKWHSVGKTETRERFKAGGPSTAISVAPVTGNFAVDKDAIKCGESVKLSWKSAEAAETTINASPQQQVQPNGERTASPTKTTTYTFQAKGPGGIVNQSQTVNVDPTVQTALTASPAEVHYRRIDDKVINPGTTTLSWTADNAQTASMDSLGAVATKGERQVPATPKSTKVGPVDEMVTYTLNARNNCGGSDKSLAAVHITGTIEPLPSVPLASVFFPTNYPTEKNPEIGLLKGEQEKLTAAVEGFKKFLEYDPDARIKILANTDRRSSNEYNMALSERRGNIVKQHLVALGMKENKIEVVPQGETQMLDRAAVNTLEDENPDSIDRPITSGLVQAYNRRVDLLMIPTKKPIQQSVRFFPEDSAEAALLQRNAQPKLGLVQKASGTTGTTTASNK
jgi:OmpA family protein/PEGA domain-containing protein